MVRHGIPVLIKNWRIANREELNKYLAGKNDGWYLLSIKKPSTEITIQQHRYYRSIVLKTCQEAIFDSSGDMYPVDEIHEELKKRYGRRKFILGGKSEVTKSMAQYNKEDYSNYLDDVRGWLYDKFEVILPEPKEYDLENA